MRPIKTMKELLIDQAVDGLFHTHGNVTALADFLTDPKSKKDLERAIKYFRKVRNKIDDLRHTKE